MSETQKKPLNTNLQANVQEVSNNFIKSDYIIKSHDLIQQGYKVYLLAQGTNVPYKGSRGHLDATNNVRELTDMFLEYGSNSNIGIILKDTGLVVLDIDRHTPNKNGLASLKKAGITPNFDNEVIEKTPRNGFHVFYYIPKWFDIEKINHNPLPGVEIITDKITVAPSIKLVDGGGIGYQHFGKEFINANLMPDWLIELIKPQNKISSQAHSPMYSVPERWEMVLNGFTQGQRNSQCVSLSGYLLRISLNPNTAYEIVQLINKNSDIPLPDNEVHTVFKSAYKREKARRERGVNDRI